MRLQNKHIQNHTLIYTNVTNSNSAKKYWKRLPIWRNAPHQIFYNAHTMLYRGGIWSGRVNLKEIKSNWVKIGPSRINLYVNFIKS
jgi:hypothetical protein